MRTLKDKKVKENYSAINIDELLKGHNKKIIAFIGIRKKWNNFYGK